MNIELLKERLQWLGYKPVIKFREWEKTEVVHILQELNELNFFGDPKVISLGFAWYHKNKIYLNYRRRIPHPDIREFLSIEEIVSFIQEEFPLMEEK